MTDARYAELMDDDDSFLTDCEKKEGWHFCWDWDGLLVGYGTPEWGDNPLACRCGFEKPRD